VSDPLASYSKVGKLFTSSAMAVAELRAAPAVAKAAEVLASAIRAAAPYKSGRLARAIGVVGFGFSKRVKLDVYYAVPLDQGWAPNATNVGIRKAGRKRAKVSGPQHRIPGKEFAYKTFDRLASTLQQQYLAQIGPKVVEDLDS
jgi:hypothetical protein